MGAAISKNAAENITDIMNQVEQSVSNNIDNEAVNKQHVDLIGCTIDGKLTITNTMKSRITNLIVAKQSQDGTIENEVTQKALQVATSKVGLGAGYASAANVASNVVKASSRIVSSMRNSANNNMRNMSSFTCSNSTIHGDVEISSNGEFNTISTMSADSGQQTAIANDIVQDISQTASATVALSFIGPVIIALLIIGVLYMALKGVNSPIGKVLIAASLLTIVGGTLCSMWMAGSAPFFNTPPLCDADGSFGACPQNTVVDLSETVIDVKTPPLRYSIPLFDVGSDKDLTLGLISQAIYVSNHADVNTVLRRAGITPDVGSIISVKEVVDDLKKAKLYQLRLELCQIIRTIPLNIKLIDDEESPATSLVYSHRVPVSEQDLIRGVSGVGTVKGKFGACNTPSYRMFKYRGYFLGGLVTILVGVIVLMFVA